MEEIKNFTLGRWGIVVFQPLNPSSMETKADGSFSMGKSSCPVSSK
jgi:hypothetical protein